MTAWICATCGNQHADTARPPGACAICVDERQWVPPAGQRWTTLDELAAQGHRSDVRRVEPGLIGIGVNPPVAIGQRALLVRTDAGNLLWDPPGFVDEAAFDAVRDAGGLAAVSASHPHFYATIVEWSHAFGAEILVPEADRQWLMRPDPAVTLWCGQREILPGVTLVQSGGHFEGSAVVHVAAAAGGRGALLVGDTLVVTPGEDRVTFIRSAPNRLPLPQQSVQRVLDSLVDLEYDRIYGGWWEPTIHHHAKEIVASSGRRYIEWLTGEALLSGAEAGSRPNAEDVARGGAE
jgi:hypothetical protein